MHHRNAWLCAIGVSALVTACRPNPAREGTGGGTLLIATGGDADALLPPLVGNSVGKEVADALFLPLAVPSDSLGTVGDIGYRGVLAQRWTWSPDSMAISFALDPRARWHDGRPVTSGDLKFALSVFVHPAIRARAAAQLKGVDSISTPDSLTATVWFRQRSPTQFYDVATNLYAIPRHVYGSIPVDSLAGSAVTRTPVGNGRFRLGRWAAGERIEVVADTTHWLGRPGLDRVAWLVVPDPTSQASMLVAGEADMVEVLRGPALDLVAKDTAIRLVVSPSYAFAVATFNLRDPNNTERLHPIFGDVRMRQALSMALNRSEIVANVLDTLGQTMESPYVSEAHLSLKLQPFDAAHARALLDSLGWRDTNGDSVRDRGGRKLAFTLTAPVSSAQRVQATTLMQQAFRAVGAEVTLQHVESGVQMSNAASGKFDLTLLGYSGDPSPASLRQYWGSARSSSGSNVGHFADRTFDATIDSAAANLSPTAAREQYLRAGQRLADLAPAIWIYQPKIVSGIHKRFNTAPMPAWGWWTHLAEWSVDPKMRLPRDLIGVR